MTWLFLSSAALFPLLEMGSVETLSAESMARLRLLLLPSILMAPFLVLLRAKAIIRLLRDHPTLPLLLAWIWATTLWSVDPEISGRRALTLTANTLIACFVTVVYPPAAILRRLFGVAAAILALSVAFAVLWPSMAFMPAFGEFRGVFTHKNGMGNLLVLAAVVAAVGARTGLLSQLSCAAVFVTVAGLVVPTSSSTALMLLLFLIALHLPLAVARLPPRAATVAMSFVMMAALAIALPLVFGRNRIFMALGRDATLTGRTEIWGFVRGLIDQRPMLGYGYEAMLDRPDVREHLFNLVGWAAPNAHNGYLELWLGTGLVGLLLTLAFLLAGLIAAWRQLFDNPRSVAAGLACIYLPIYLFRNFSESDLLVQSEITWIIAAIAVLAVGRERQARHSDARATDNSARAYQS